MKQQFKRPYRSESYSASDYIQVELNGADYERGAVEQAFAQAENTTKAFSRLAQLLFEKGVLSENDIYYIARGYIHEE